MVQEMAPHCGMLLLLLLLLCMWLWEVLGWRTAAQQGHAQQLQKQHRNAVSGKYAASDAASCRGTIPLLFETGLDPTPKLQAETSTGLSAGTSRSASLRQLRHPCPAALKNSG